MYNGIGLTTPRGSGTSGYVVRNLSTLRNYEKQQDRGGAWDAAPPKHREPDQGILEHERKRGVEVKCLELQVKLEDDEVDEAEIEKQVSALREKLLANLNASLINARSLKPSDTHALAAAKKVELEKMARALGTRNDYKEGDSFDREKQEELRLRRIAEREIRDQRKQDTMAEQKKKWEEKKRNDDRRRDDGRGMPPPSIPTGPRNTGRIASPPRERDGESRRRARSPPPPARPRDVEMRDRSDRSPPPRPRKRSPSHSPSRSRSRSPGYAPHKRRAPERSASPPRRPRSPARRTDRRRPPSYSRSRSASRGRSHSRSISASSRSRSASRSISHSRSPPPRRRGVSPPPSSSRKPVVPVPTPGYTRTRDDRERELPPHMKRGSPPPRGGPFGRAGPLKGGRGWDREKSPRRGGASPPPRGRTPDKRSGGGRGRSASTGSSMSVSSGSRSRSRD